MGPPASKPWISALLLAMMGGWLTILFAESSQPPAAIMGEVPGLDKVAHISAFCILGLLVCALSFHLHPRPAIPLFSMPLLMVSLCGIAEECFQLFIPGRSASLPDVLADICGAVIAIVLANHIARLSRSYAGFRS